MLAVPKRIERPDRAALRALGASPHHEARETSSRNAAGDAPRFPSSRGSRANAFEKKHGGLASTGGKRDNKTGREKPPREDPTAVQRALRLLSSRARTAVELERALGRAGVDPTERAAALARMRELGYIDDASVAEARAKRLVGRGDSPRLVTRRLQMQGVSAEAAQAAANEAAGGASDDQLAAQALEKKLRGRPVRDEREKQRLMRSLVQHGHRPSSAAKALQLSMDGAEITDGDVDGE